MHAKMVQDNSITLLKVAQSDRLRSLSALEGVVRCCPLDIQFVVFFFFFFFSV